MKIPGSARLQRAGFGILPKRTFSKTFIVLRKSRSSKKSSRTPEAFASTQDACAPHRVHARSFLENQPASTMSNTEKQSR